MKKTANFMLCTLFVAAMFASCGGGSNNGKGVSGNETEKPRVKVAYVESRQVDQIEEFTANVEAENTNSIAPSSPMRIKDILVEVGDYVKKGQKLVQMDEAALIQSRTQLENIKVEFARNIQLAVDDNTIAYLDQYSNYNATGYRFSLDRFEDKKLVSHLTARTIVYDTIKNNHTWKLRDYMIRDFDDMRERIIKGDSKDTIINMMKMFVSTNYSAEISHYKPIPAIYNEKQYKLNSLSLDNTSLILNSYLERYIKNIRTSSDESFEHDCKNDGNYLILNSLKEHKDVLKKDFDKNFFDTLESKLSNYYLHISEVSLIYSITSETLQCSKEHS